MIAGILNEVIEIWTPTIVRDEFGNQHTEYQYNFSTRASVSHKTGNRQIDNDEVVYIYSKTFKVSYYHNIDEFSHIKWNGKMYRIMEIEPNKRTQELTIETELIDD